MPIYLICAHFLFGFSSFLFGEKDITVIPELLIRAFLISLVILAGAKYFHFKLLGLKFFELYAVVLIAITASDFSLHTRVGIVLPVALIALVTILARFYRSYSRKQYLDKINNSNKLN
jgi:hypothetical protein